MGTIFQGNRIRERHDRKGKALVYQPTLPIIPDKNGRGTREEREANAIKEGMENALEAHNRVWTWLSKDQREKASPRWMKDLISRLLLEKKKADWQGVFTTMLPDFDSLVYQKPGDPEKDSEVKDPLEVGNLIDSRNNYLGYSRYAPEFPLYSESKMAVLAVIRELLTTGTLIKDPKSKERKPIYDGYREDLKDDKERALLTSRVKEIQTVMIWGKHWKTFFAELNPPVTKITDLKQAHGDQYKAWRVANRLHGEKGKKISHNQIKREISYMRQLLEWAINEDLIYKNVLRGYKIKKAKRDVMEGSIERPYNIAQVSEILEWAYDNWQAYPAVNDRDKKRRKERKLNWLTMVFLACVGCRPKEVNQFQLKNGQLSFVGGKTKSARRTVVPTPTIMKVISDPLFKENGKTLGIAQRVSQYMERGLVKKFGDKGREYTCYRFRHFVATIRLYLGESPQYVADQLGHSSSTVTEEKYGHLKVMVESGGREKVKTFWEHLNQDYFKKFPI